MSNQFVDTNILVYAHDLDAGTKHQKASQLIASLWQNKSGVLSSQVLQEFASVLLSKFKRTSKEVIELISPYLLAWPIILVNGTSLIEAIELMAKIKCSFWDALIFQAATEAQVDIIYSEDFSHNQKIGSLKIVNPFK